MFVWIYKPGGEYSSAVEEPSPRSVLHRSASLAGSFSRSSLSRVTAKSPGSSDLPGSRLNESISFYWGDQVEGNSGRKTSFIIAKMIVNNCFRYENRVTIYKSIFLCSDLIRFADIDSLSCDIL